MGAAPKTRYVVVGADSAPALSHFGLPSAPDEHLHEADVLALAIAPAARDWATRWLPALPEHKWLFLLASTDEEAQWLARHTKARVAWASGVARAIEPGAMQQTPHGPMMSRSPFEDALAATMSEYDSWISSLTAGGGPWADIPDHPSPAGR